MLAQKMLSKEGILIILGRKINFDRDKKESRPPNQIVTIDR